LPNVLYIRSQDHAQLSRTIDQDIEDYNVKKNKYKREYNAAEQACFVEGTEFFESGFHE
jgi:hypothetical protein